MLTVVKRDTDMKVKLTTHAVERFWERFGVDLQDHANVNLPKGVVVSRHKHQETGNNVVELVFPVKGKIAMGVVDVDDQKLVTVYSDGPYYDKRIRQATAMMMKKAA